MTTGDRLHRFDRWLYRGGRPNRLARFLNRGWAWLSSTGLIMPGRLATLEVRGRRTGKPVSLPVVLTARRDDRYLVSMLGENVNWVRNLRAAEGRAVLRHGRREQVKLVEVAPDERAPVLRDYLRIAPGARAHFPVPPDAPEAEFARIAPAYPVFRVTEAR